MSRSGGGGGAEAGEGLLTKGFEEMGMEFWLAPLAECVARLGAASSLDHRIYSRTAH